MWKTISPNAIEIAIKIKELQLKESLTIKETALKLNITYDKAKFLLTLLNLEEEVKIAIKLNLLKESHGKQLLRLNDREIQLRMYLFILSHKTSFRELKKIVDKIVKYNDYDRENYPYH
ncbi:hypothetical protein H7F37_03050 [Winogradskyella sp. PAMC22761]|nr:hypothetical protein H7F37_03050 [Winogradskyella sp. PAMC22761]